MDGMNATATTTQDGGARKKRRLNPVDRSSHPNKLNEDAISSSSEASLESSLESSLKSTSDLSSEKQSSSKSDDSSSSVFPFLEERGECDITTLRRTLAICLQFDLAQKVANFSGEPIVIETQPSWAYVIRYGKLLDCFSLDDQEIHVEGCRRFVFPHNATCRDVLLTLSKGHRLCGQFSQTHSMKFFKRQVSKDELYSDSDFQATSTIPNTETTLMRDFARFEPQGLPVYVHPYSTKRSKGCSIM